MISATEVIVQEKIYNRYSEGNVWKCANMVYTHMILNTQDPIITITVGTRLLPILRDAAIVQSMKAENP